MRAIGAFWVATSALPALNGTGMSFPITINLQAFAFFFAQQTLQGFEATVRLNVRLLAALSHVPQPVHPAQLDPLYV